MSRPDPSGTWHRSVLVRAAVALAVVMAAVAGGAWLISDDGPPDGGRDEGTATTVPSAVAAASAAASPAQRQAAADLVSEVRGASARFASVDDAEAAGYASIGDAFTGEEHFTSAAALADDVDLDVEHPEALVYDVRSDGSRRLAAFMFMRPAGSRVADAPIPGGPITRWHAHGDLCQQRTPQPRIAGITDATGTCPDGLTELAPFPTLHVWVVAHPCGPFAELEGVGVRAGAVSGACTHRHG